LGTTRHTRDRTTRRWPPIVYVRRSVLEQHRRLLPRSGGQGVAGSNPAVPTGSQIFSNVFMPYREPAKEPISLRNDLLRPCADRVPRCPTRAFATTAELRSRLVKGSKIAEPLPEQPRSPGATRRLTAAQRWMTRSSKPAFDRGARAALGGVLPYRAAAWVGPPGGWVEEYERH
jgi:hypothetical protein